MEELVLATTPTPISRSDGSIVDSAEGFTDGASPRAHSDSDQAHATFWEEVRRLPGVRRAERWGEDGPGAPVYHIYVDPDDLETEYAINELKGEIYDRFPKAHLNVVVLVVTEGNPPFDENDHGS